MTVERTLSIIKPDAVGATSLARLLADLKVRVFDLWHTSLAAAGAKAEALRRAQRTPLLW